MRTKRVFVTGASGYIGGALIRELAIRDVEVVAFSRRNISYFADIKTKLVDSYDDVPPDPAATIVHLAELSDINEAERRGKNYIAEVSNCVNALRKKKFARFVYVSSASLYPTTSNVPLTVHSPVEANSTYARAKIAGESLVIQSSGVVARLANIYGLPLKPGTIIFDIFRQLPSGNKIEVQDDNPARDYLWLGDAARGLADIALGSATGIFNLGSGKAASPLEIVQLVLAARNEVGRQFWAKKSKQHNQVNMIALDYANTTSQFGWRPSMTLSDGIRALLASEQ